MSNILDGKILAGKIKESLSQEVAALKAKTGKVPQMVNIIVGDEHGASVYSKSQSRVAAEIGINYRLITLPPDTTEAKLIEAVQKLAADQSVHGIMVHKPLPSNIDYQVIASHISPDKDLEGINDINMGRLMMGEKALTPCTPAAVMEHLKASGVKLRGKEAVVIGVSEIVGKPVVMLLTKERATVTACHSGTSEAGKLAEHIGRADIVVAAIGKANFIKGDWIKKGAIVIDVGINSLNGKTVGDVDFESAKERAGYITPVPGGVGPVTVAMLMKNAIEAFKQQMKV